MTSQQNIFRGSDDIFVFVRLEVPLLFPLKMASDSIKEKSPRLVFVRKKPAEKNRTTFVLRRGCTSHAHSGLPTNHATVQQCSP